MKPGGRYIEGVLEFVHRPMYFSTPYPRWLLVIRRADGSRMVGDTPGDRPLPYDLPPTGTMVRAYYLYEINCACVTHLELLL